MRLVLTFATLGVLAAADPNTLTPQEKSAGWKLLFDGKTFNGWVDPSKGAPPGDSWTIDGGALKATAKPKLREDLFTTESFQDFELSFEWKISPGGNSGLKYRIQDRFFIDEGRIRSGEFKKFEDLANESLRTRAARREKASQEYIVGFEYQVIDDSKHADAQRGPLYQAGALYSMLPATSRTAKAPGEYNIARIIVKGNQIEHWLNGVKVVTGSLDSEGPRTAAAKRWSTNSPIYTALATLAKKSSPICLQNHNDEVWFRSIKIRPIR